MPYVLRVKYPSNPCIVRLPESFIIVTVESLFRLEFINTIDAMSVFGLPLIPHPRRIRDISNPVAFMYGSLTG